MLVMKKDHALTAKKFFVSQRFGMLIRKHAHMDQRM